MHQRFLMSFAATLALSVVVASSGSAQNVYSTGTFVAGVDQNWTVSTGTGGVFSSVFGPAFAAPAGYPQPNFITNVVGGSNGFAPWYTFRQTFNLTGFDPLTAFLSFQWGCDDVPGAVSFTPVFSLNGGATQGSGTCGGYNIAAGSVTNVTSGFGAGVNTLDYFVVGNGTTDAFGLNVLSFRAQVSGPPGDVVPEPATMGLLATGLLSIAGLRRRKKV